jgi:hypothetical protein
VSNGTPGGDNSNDCENDCFTLISLAGNLYCLFYRVMIPRSVIDPRLLRLGAMGSWGLRVSAGCASLAAHG